MSADKTVGQLYLEELAKKFADMTAGEADLGFGGKYSDFREPLAQVEIYRKAEAEAQKTYNGKTPDEIKAEAEKFHKKTPGKLQKEGKEITPDYWDTTTITEIEEKGLEQIISETASGDSVNLPEMTIAEDEIVTLKDGVKLEGVDAPATEEPRQGETVIEGALAYDSDLDIYGVTLTKNALTDNSSTVESSSVINSRILELNPAS